MDYFDKEDMSEYFKKRIEEYRSQQHVESEKCNKFSILMKMGLFTLLEYKMLRFVNTTNRHCFISVTDCTGSYHILNKLNPGQSVLMLSPKSKHNFKAIDTCNHEQLSLDFSEISLSHEYICRIKTNMDTLKNLTLKILSDKYSRAPHEIEYLKLPRQLKHELYFLTIPFPEKRTNHLFCHECWVRLPKMLDCNPVTLCMSSAPKGSWKTDSIINELRKLSNSLDDYFPVSNVLLAFLGESSRSS